MDDAALVGTDMVEPALEIANRRLLDAIEAPPETGVEPQLDRLAAITWYYAVESDRRPDPGRLRLLHTRLSRLDGNLEGRKRLLVRDAASAIEVATDGLDAV